MLTVVAAVTLSAAALVACGGGGDTQTVTETISEETTTAVEGGGASDNSQPEPTDGAAKSGGIEVAVTDAYAKPAVSYEGGTYSSFTPNAEPKTIKAPQGGRYVYVVTKVTNESSEGLDLTCGYPMEVKLVDDSDRRFDPVENLDYIAGNPECNAQLQPGFTDKMTYVFLVPPGAESDAFRFAQVTENLEDKPPAEIAISGV